MRERKLRDQSGITLVEIIIVIAIVGILASTSVMMLGHLHYANTQKVVQTLDSTLDKLQVTTLSKTGNYYLYVYKLDDGYYARILSDDLSAFDSAKLTDDGTKLCNNTIKLYGVPSSGSKKQVGESDYFIKISYTKAALFDSNTNVKGIDIDGVPHYQLDLVTDTGKHFIKK